MQRSETGIATGARLNQADKKFLWGNEINNYNIILRTLCLWVYIDGESDYIAIMVLNCAFWSRLGRFVTFSDQTAKRPAWARRQKLLANARRSQSRDLLPTVHWLSRFRRYIAKLDQRLAYRRSLV